jgi:ketosteroid isomerase-like protein
MKTLLLAITLGAALLHASTDEDAVRDAERRWAAAVLARDLPALDKIFADNIIYAHATGNVETKQHYIDRLKTGKQRYDTIQHESTKVVMYGDAAVAHSIGRMTGNTGQPFNDHLMIMHCCVTQNGAWRLAAHQTSKLAE